jgi:ubiquinone/menaquinone biosynthesis C-methylase UbiE
MATNPSLQILGLQALPRLVEKFNTESNDFLTFSDLYGKTVEEFTKACDNCVKILHRLFEKHQISWRDVFSNSDIGRERNALARDIGLEKDDTILEMGCGRGYFSIAAATVSSNVIGLDMMNGLGRHSWWSNFKETVRELRLEPRIVDLKAEAQSIPLREGSVDKAVAAHSIRNFQSKQAIQNTISEMNRVLTDDGEMILAETLPSPRNNAQEAHLAFYRCKCKYGWGDLPYFSQEELSELFEEIGIAETTIQVVDYNLSAAPPIFWLNTSRLKDNQVEEAQRQYYEALEMIRKYGEASPPTAIIRAKKHSK